ncbi:hypothetical protein [Sphaerisporangium perillae]|uniref:hypothetical protein n=1 Tax=Sphaerisporangium perillae TaxID=2935860 RepID=UPI0020107A41|nr:hypothetical protein [Sphaerisporangium perillae]
MRTQLGQRRYHVRLANALLMAAEMEAMLAETLGCDPPPPVDDLRAARGQPLRLGPALVRPVEVALLGVDASQQVQHGHAGLPLEILQQLRGLAVAPGSWPGQGPARG